jgi:hypothetical protein
MKNTNHTPLGSSEVYKEIVMSSKTTISGSFDAKTKSLISKNPYQIFQNNKLIYSGCLKIDSEDLKFHGQGCYYLDNLKFQGEFIDSKPDTNSQFNVNSATGDGSLLYQGSINCFFKQHGLGIFFLKSGSDIFSVGGRFDNGNCSPNSQYDISKNGLLIYRGQIKNLRTATLDRSPKSNADEAEESDSLFLFHGEGAFYRDQNIFRGKFIDGAPDKEAIFEIEFCKSKLKYYSKITSNFEPINPKKKVLATFSQANNSQANSQEEEKLKWEPYKYKLADGTFAFKSDSLIIVHKDNKTGNLIKEDSETGNFITPKSIAKARDEQINKIL